MKYIEQLERENRELKEQVKELLAEVKYLRKKLEKYEDPEKDSSNSSKPPSSDKEKKYPFEPLNYADLLSNFKIKIE